MSCVEHKLWERVTLHILTQYLSIMPIQVAFDDLSEFTQLFHELVNRQSGKLL